MSGYGITFAPTLDRPPETMVGETVYDSEGVAIGWITNAPAEPDEATMLKLHERMNAALLDMNDELLALHTQDRENASSKKLIDCVIAAHQIIEDAATVGVGTCKDVCASVSEFTCSECGFNCDLMSWISLFDGDDGRHRHHHHGTPNFCPNCGARVVGA